MNDVVIIKLISGIELIGEHNKTEFSNKIVIDNPYMLQVIPGPEGMSVGIIPIDLLAEYPIKQIQVDPNTLICPPYQPKKNLIDTYLSKKSGIQIASVAAQ